MKREKRIKKDGYKEPAVSMNRLPNPEISSPFSLIVDLVFFFLNPEEAGLLGTPLEGIVGVESER